MLVFYIRHGDPIYTPDQLTPLGERQAESVAKRLALFGIDEVYSSTSTRAMQTAKPTCEITKRELKTLDWMHETKAHDEMAIWMNEKVKTWVWAHPVYSQILTRKDVRDMGDKWYEHPELKDFHFEKSLQRIGSELDAFFASFGYEHDREKGLYKVTNQQKEKRIAIFAHEGFGKIFMSELLDIPFPLYSSHFEMKHTGMTVIRFDDRFNEYARARVLTVSNDSHLYRDGLPLNHQSTLMRDRY